MKEIRLKTASLKSIYISHYVYYQYLESVLQIIFPPQSFQPTQNLKLTDRNSLSFT